MLNSFSSYFIVTMSSSHHLLSLWEKWNPLVLSELNYIDTKDMTNVALSFHRCSPKDPTKCTNK